MSVKFENDVDRFSYALAMNIAGSVLQIPLELNRGMMAETFTALMNGAQPELPPDEFQRVMQEFQAKLQQQMQAKADAAGKQNQEAGKKFLDENAKKDGVKVTASGLQYQVLKEGQGEMPKASDVVKVHYEGTLINGQVFDSSIRRGEPAEFPVNQVIPGWVEALQLMKKGSKYRLFIPSELAYGERGAGEMIGPHSTLIFDVELIDIKK